MWSGSIRQGDARSARLQTEPRLARAVATCATHWRTPTELRTLARRGHGAGFTLVEVLVVTAIVAILAAIAYPSYQAQLRKGHRAAAQSYLMDLAQRQQQYMLDARSYAGTAVALGYSATPTEVSPWYTVDIAPSDSPPTFTITARAIGSQAADAAVLSIDNVGNKLPSDKW